ncbi:hypothetical protein ACIBLB_39715 [Streptosporangium canum]|uniref:hypothetical protein n=1 Tax=Streptosporangium canum TaxID=324952 RepID=UPI00378D8FE2
MTRVPLRRPRSTADVTFDETRSEICDTGCRASASVDRARTNALLARRNPMNPGETIMSDGCCGTTAVEIERIVAPAAPGTLPVAVT